MKVAKEGAILLLLSVKSCTCTVPIGQSWVNGGGHLKFNWVGLVDVGKSLHHCGANARSTFGGLAIFQDHA